MVVGFNGTPLVECGRALPVARRKSDGMHCVLQLRGEGEAIAWHTENEADSYVKSGRWTRFREPVFVPRACVAEADERLVRQPMVIFADEAMLDTADRLPHRHSYRDEYLIWRRLTGYADTIQATCGSAETIEQLLDDWASGLLRRFDAMYHLGRDAAYLKRIADFALCAAKSRQLRWRAYLRYASVQDAERVRQTFESFAHREFPNATWEAFLDEVKSVCDVLHAVPTMAVQSALPSSPVTALPKVSGIAAARPLHVPTVAQ
jgi:macrodomain Ter protein organizer (MatP/YcbG family)